MRVTTEQVKIAVKKKFGNDFIPLRQCSICKEYVGYYPQNNDDILWFDSSCGCCGGGGRYCSHSDIADTINMQSNPEAAKMLMEHFGLNFKLTKEL